MIRVLLPYHLSLPCCQSFWGRLHFFESLLSYVMQEYRIDYCKLPWFRLSQPMEHYIGL
jgi:hypothetical protein